MIVSQWCFSSQCVIHIFSFILTWLIRLCFVFTPLFDFIHKRIKNCFLFFFIKQVSRKFFWAFHELLPCHYNCLQDHLCHISIFKNLFDSSTKLWSFVAVNVHVIVECNSYFLLLLRLIPETTNYLAGFHVCPFICNKCKCFIPFIDIRFFLFHILCSLHSNRVMYYQNYQKLFFILSFVYFFVEISHFYCCF